MASREAIVDDAAAQGERLMAAYRRLSFDAASGDAFAEVVFEAREMICSHISDREAAVDALMDETLRLIAGTSTYDPAKLNLLSFLRMVVKRKVSNHRRGEGRRKGHETSLVLFLTDSVASEALPGNEMVEGEWEEAKLAEARALLDPGDFDLLLAIRRGAGHGELAAILGVDLADLPAARKRAADRIRQRLKRGGLI